YVRAILSVLEASETTRVPVVGFVDTSRARDFATALSRLRDIPAQPPGDAALLAPLMGWGDRTELLRCARDDRLAGQLAPELGYYEHVLFTYLKTTASGPPARLDLPDWLLEAGLVEWVLDAVRAECIVGTGYPYAIETADAVSVITLRDREQFYRVFQDFLGSMNIELRYARKAYSKRGRR
ncbi:MAG: DNA double-strand break repair nuclease NurA, partial [Anaerolineae bacterium]|nr:DNA double-strand break repair nuclease NurA [Anaerolineae bacterium]